MGRVIWEILILYPSPSINLFLITTSYYDLPDLASVFSGNIDKPVAFLFSLQLMMIAADYSIANVIKIEDAEGGEDEHLEANKRRKDQAASFFANWEKFSDQEGFLLLTKASCFLMEASSLETCLICQVPVPIKSCSWACAAEKIQDMIKTSLKDCSPFYRLLDGQGSVACCGSKRCNTELFCLFQSSLTDLKLTIELLELSPDFVFNCDFCHINGSVDRCSGCKSRWYCGVECQMEDWKLVHKELCNKFVKKGKKLRLNSQNRKEYAKKLTERNKKIHSKSETDKLMRSLMWTRVVLLLICLVGIMYQTLHIIILSTVPINN